MEQGIPPAEASRLAVQSSLQAALEVSFERWGRMWLCAVLLLVLGMFCILIWSQWVYDDHRDDQCDQPLATMLRLLYVIIAVHAFQREIIKHILCYSMTRDGPDEPCRVRLLRRTSVTATLLWPFVGGWMLSQTHDCSPQLQLAVEVISMYYGLVAFVAIILPACCITAMTFLLRRGLIRMPRSRNAAPAELIEQLPKVVFEEARFQDSPYPAQCPICMDDFSAAAPITITTCRPNAHVFHTECLGDWLQCARTCPLCRVDLTEEAPAQGEAADASSRTGRTLPMPRVVDPELGEAPREPTSFWSDSAPATA